MTTPLPAFSDDDHARGVRMTEPLDERALIERVRAGDRGAFETIYRAHYRQLVGFVYSYIHSEALAEEQVQDLFLTLWRLRERWELRTTLRAYLYRAARNRALDLLRHHRVEEAAGTSVSEEGSTFGMSEPAAALDAVVEADEVARAARRAVEQLPPRCRMVFTLRRDRDLSYAEIAQVMDISEHTVRIQMTNALRTIRRALAPWLT